MYDGIHVKFVFYAFVCRVAQFYSDQLVGELLSGKTILIVDFTKLCRFTKKYKKQKKRIFGVRLRFKNCRLGF